MLESKIKNPAMAVGFRGVLYEKGLDISIIAFIALLASVNYELFVFPNQFAPSGINGICTMIQYVTGVSVGYLSLFINIPLAIWCYFEVSKPMAIRSMVYVVTFSLGLLILDKVDLSAFAYVHGKRHQQNSRPHGRGRHSGFVYSILIKPAPIPRHGFRFRHCP